MWQEYLTLQDMGIENEFFYRFLGQGEVYYRKETDPKATYRFLKSLTIAQGTELVFQSKSHMYDELAQQERYRLSVSGDGEVTPYSTNRPSESPWFRLGGFSAWGFSTPMPKQQIISKAKDLHDEIIRVTTLYKSHDESETMTVRP